MKFQFCGNINCPEWFIAEISVLTKITAVKIKLIFSQLILAFLENADINAKVLKFLNGTGLDRYEMSSVIATLKFILQNSVTFNISEITLNKELIDLGLPKENVESITKTYKNNLQKLSSKAGENILKTSGNISMKYSIHELLSSSQLGQIKNLNVPKATFAQIFLQHENKISQKIQKTSFIVDKEGLDYMIFQIQGALEVMEKIQHQKLKKSQKSFE